MLICIPCEFHHQIYNIELPRMRTDAFAMGRKGNVALYLDKELEAKSKLMRA